MLDLRAGTDMSGSPFLPAYHSWLVVGGWWLVVGGWWLAVGGWRLVVGGLRLGANQ
jgi:hypothetical protein